MRLFIAIDVPDTVKEHLAFLQRSLELPGIRLVHPKNIHLTLNFLGERDPERIKRILETITFVPFTLKLSTIGFFPNEQEPSVVWVGLEDNEELFKLQRQIDLHFEPDKSFKAHLTLGRIKKKSPKEQAAIAKAAQQLPLKPLTFNIDTFKLYQSTLTPLGPVYEVVEAYKAAHL